MSTIIITKEQFNALQVAKAGPKDVRYYLHGIHVDLKRDLIESTDGHRCLRIINLNSEKRDEEYIINVQGKAPAKTEKVLISKNNITFADKSGNIISMIIPQVIDARFPDTNRVIPLPSDINKQSTELKELSINPLYLYDVAKALLGNNFLTVKVIFLEDMSVMVEFGELINIEYKIMLVRS